jgi:hypothetical protein
MHETQKTGLGCAPLPDGLINNTKEKQKGKTGGKPKERWKIARECRMEKIGASKKSRRKKIEEARA